MLKYGLYGAILGAVTFVLFVLCEMFVSSNLYANLRSSGMLFVIGMVLITYLCSKAERM